MKIEIGKSRPWENSPEKHDEEMREAVAQALDRVARDLRDGIEPEGTISNLDPAPPSSLTAHVREAVIQEVCNVLIAHRDHGSVEDRVINKKGQVLFPIEQLTPEQRRWLEEEIGS